MELLREDPVMAELIAEHGRIALQPADDPFQRLVTSIVNQQLSTASAAVIRDRLFDRFTVTPAGILAADEDALQETGLSRQKIDYLRSAADHFESGVDREQFAGRDDDAVIDELTGIRGIGTWTAKMFLIFVLAREDVFPVEDLGIRNGMRALYDAEMTRDEMVEQAEDWRPYRSYASRYVWKHIDGG